MSIHKEDIRIVRLSPADAQGGSDHFLDFHGKIMESEHMYPGIKKWLKDKVTPGIRSQERAAFVGYLGEKPVVTAVAKKGENAKVCHLKIDPSLQNTNLGEVFFSLLGVEIRPMARSVHFTLPESLWTDKHNFFQSFGFQAVKEHSLQYRLIDPELRSECSFSSMWANVLEKMPKLSSAYSLGGFSMNSDLLFSIRPEFAAKIMRGEKTIELRRKFSTRWIGSTVSIYASAPVMGLIGEAKISTVIPGTPELIWRNYQNNLGCTQTQFEQYTAGCDEIYAIELDEVRPYRDVVPAVWASKLLSHDLRPPQSYLTLANNKGWSQAVSLAAYIHGCFNGTSCLENPRVFKPSVRRLEKTLEKKTVQMQLAI